jgi:hypothetical protein
MRKFILDYKLDEHGLADLLQEFSTVEERVSTVHILAPSDGAQGKMHVEPRQVFRYIARK